MKKWGEDLRKRQFIIMIFLKKITYENYKIFLKSPKKLYMKNKKKKTFHIIDVVDRKSSGLLELCRSSRRISLEELHRPINFSEMCMASSNHQAGLAARIAKACKSYGVVCRNLSRLCEEILQMDISGVKNC